MARFTRTLATLVAAGVDIIKALEISGQTAGNWVIESALADVRAKVHQGVPIAQPLIEDPVFPPLVSQMVKVGEETGELEKMLDKIADFYEDEVDTSIAALTSIVEPLMMIGVGVIVGDDRHRDVPADVQAVAARRIVQITAPQGCGARQKPYRAVSVARKPSVRAGAGDHGRASRASTGDEVGDGAAPPDKRVLFAAVGESRVGGRRAPAHRARKGVRSAAGPGGVDDARDIVGAASRANLNTGVWLKPDRSVTISWGQASAWPRSQVQERQSPQAPCRTTSCSSIA